MKHTSLSISASLLAILFSSFSIRAIDTWFTFDSTATSNANVFNPASYTLTGSSPSNPANDFCILKYIKVDQSTEVYPSNYSVAAYQGKPKVDISGNELSSRIEYAIENCIDVADRVFLQ